MKNLKSPLFELKLLAMSVGTTFMETFLLSAAAFIPTYSFRIGNPWIILPQFVSVTAIIGFFQGRRFTTWLELANQGRAADKGNILIKGIFAALPLNIGISLIYSSLKDYLLELTHSPYLPYILYGALLVNFAASILGSWRGQVRLASEQKPRGTGMFTIMVWVMLFSWGIIFSLLVFALKLNISPRFPQ